MYNAAGKTVQLNMRNGGYRKHNKIPVPRTTSANINMKNLEFVLGTEELHKIVWLANKVNLLLV